MYSRTLLATLALLPFTLSSLGCNDAAANGPEHLQGILEYEDRVLALEVGGRVASVAVRRGDAVTPETLLLKVDDGLERPMRDARAAEVAMAKAELSLLESGARPSDVRGAQAEMRGVSDQLKALDKQVERQRRLVASGAAPASVLDQLEAQVASLSGHRISLSQRVRTLRDGARDEELEAARARIMVAEAGLASIDARLHRFSLFAPEEGVVTDVHLATGEIAAPGAPAVTIADLDHPFVDVFVPEGRLSQVRIGVAVRAHVDGVEGKIEGRVEHIFPDPEFTPRFLFSEEERPNIVVRVRVRLEDPEHLLHAGIPAFVELLGTAR